MLTLDLGISHRQQRTVVSLIGERLPATLPLTGTAFLFARAAGVTLAAPRVGTWMDSLITVVSLLFYATPIFRMGLMLILVFSVGLGWLPSFGMGSVGVMLHGWARVVDVASYLVLPSLTLGLFYMAVCARLTPAALLVGAGQDFVRTARAKGATEGRIVRRHILRNALLPVVTIIGLQTGLLLSGAILTETVFAFGGMGSFMAAALFSRDFPVIQGGILFLAVVFVVVNLLVDLSYGVIDPQVRTS